MSITLCCHVDPLLLSFRPLGEISPFLPRLARRSTPTKRFLLPLEMTKETPDSSSRTSLRLATPLLLPCRSPSVVMSILLCCHVDPPLLSFRPLGEISPFLPHWARCSTLTKRFLLPLEMTEWDSCLVSSNRLVTLYLPSVGHTRPFDRLRTRAL